MRLRARWLFLYLVWAASGGVVLRGVLKAGLSLEMRFLCPTGTVASHLFSLGRLRGVRQGGAGYGAAPPSRPPLHPPRSTPAEAFPFPLFHEGCAALAAGASSLRSAISLRAAQCQRSPPLWIEIVWARCVWALFFILACRLVEVNVPRGHGGFFFTVVFGPPTRRAARRGRLWSCAPFSAPLASPPKHPAGVFQLPQVDEGCAAFAPGAFSLRSAISLRAAQCQRALLP